MAMIYEWFQPGGLLTVAEVACFLHLSTRQVYRLVEHGELGRIVRMGERAIRIHAEAVVSYIRRHESSGPAARRA